MEAGRGPALRTPRKAVASSAMQRRAPGKAAASRQLAPVGAEDAGDGFIDF